jgi:hypothetical protein
MSRATTWRDLRLGVAAFVLVVAAGLGVLWWGRVGALHGATARLYAATPHGRGILPGSEVWLDGVKVGLVRDVGFRPPSADTTTRVLLTLDVLADALPRVAREAPVEIRAGGSFVGSPIVAIDSRTADQPVARAGDTLVSRRSRELDQARADLTAATAEVPVIIDNLRVLAAQLRSARSTLGALGVEGTDRIAETGGAAAALLQTVRTGSGTVGLMLRRGQPAAQLRHAAALADSVRQLLDGPGTTLGRLRRDSTLLRTVDEVRAELTRVQAALAEPRGTAGRVRHDSALVRRIAATRAEMDALAADLRRNPLRYLTF